MNVSKFFGVTNREAMRQVRLALGSEALIISNKRVNGGVEIIAADPTALETDNQTATELAKNPALPKNTLPNNEPPVNNIPKVSQRPLRTQQNTDQIREMHGLIGELKGSLESRFDELLWANKLGQSDFAVKLFQHLLLSGFSTSLLRALIKVLPQFNSLRETINWARAEIIKNLPVLQTEADLWQNCSAIALVGPTGVGKTTTVAKIAARFVRNYGAGNLVLVTTDAYRIGAYEQLKIYAKLLKVPIYAVKSKAELQDLISGLPASSTVLIDNVGISQRDSHIKEQAKLLNNMGRKLKRLLVLNAASSGDTLDEVAKSYSNDGGPGLAGCIISKIDESTRLGAALDIAIRYRLQIQFITNGQKVPENLLLPNAKDLVDKAFYIKTGNNSFYAASQADLSALLGVIKPAQTDLVKEQIRRQKILLPRLLSSHTDKPFDEDVIVAGVKQIEDDFLLADTYDLWHGRQAGEKLQLIDSINHNRNKINGWNTGVKIIVHNHQALPQANTSGLWLSTVCFSENGIALSALGQQAGFTDRWFTQNGIMAFKPASQDMIFNQIHTENYLLQNQALHCLGGASQSLLTRLLSSQMEFITAIGSRSRLHVDGEGYTVSALANDINLQMIARTDLAFISRLGHTSLNNLSLWAGSKNVRVLIKGQHYELRLFHLSAINNLTGKPFRSWYALGQTGLPLAVISRAIILRQEYQLLMRNMIARINQDDNLLDNVFYASQCGLAAWHLSQNPVLHKARLVAAGVLGKTQLGLPNAYVGLVKLFTLKDMLA